MKTSISTSDESLNIVLTINVQDLLNSPENVQEGKRGRPRLLSPEDERLFRILLNINATPDDICQALGIGRASYFRYKQRLQSTI